jgi:hypothetical protein
LRRVDEEERREKIETADGKDRLRTKVQRKSVLARIDIDELTVDSDG